MSTYSFLDCVAAINGPGGSFSLGNGAGNSEEGITVAMGEDKNTMTIGADGSGMHSLHAGKSGTVTIRLLKTSPTNKKLMEMYNYQTSSSANHGQNNISVRNPVRGDSATCREAAFKKMPDFVNAKDGGTVEWSFDTVYIDEKLGDGTPAV
jgi:hypothetical protein